MAPRRLRANSLARAPHRPLWVSGVHRHAFGGTAALRDATTSRSGGGDGLALALDMRLRPISPLTDQQQVLHSSRPWESWGAGSKQKGRVKRRGGRAGRGAREQRAGRGGGVADTRPSPLHQHALRAAQHALHRGHHVIQRLHRLARVWGGGLGGWGGAGDRVGGWVGWCKRPHGAPQAAPTKRSPRQTRCAPRCTPPLTTHTHTLPAPPPPSSHPVKPDALHAVLPP